MSRYTGPKTKKNRTYGMAIFPAKAAFERKPYPPGQHGPRLRRKEKEHALRLNEKQKLRYLYIMTEGQFSRFYKLANNQPGVTGEVLLQLLERRLDSVVYLLGFTRTRMMARQFVAHGHIFVNGHKVDCASYTCSPGDMIEVRQRTSSRQLATRSLDDNQLRVVPSWLRLESDSFRGTVDRLPTREELNQDINEQLIVEFYSR